MTHAACALVGLSLFAVLFPAIAAAIKFDSRGSIWLDSYIILRTFWIMVTLKGL